MSNVVVFVVVVYHSTEDKFRFFASFTFISIDARGKPQKGMRVKSVFTSIMNVAAC